MKELLKVEDEGKYVYVYAQDKAEEGYDTLRECVLYFLEDSGFSLNNFQIIERDGEKAKQGGYQNCFVFCKNNWGQNANGN
jgi:phage/plasmid primase-like uncharacterized protein